MAYAELSENNQGPFEEVDAKDYAGSWYQAFIISKTSLHIMVHFSGSDAFKCFALETSDQRAPCIFDVN